MGRRPPQGIPARQEVWLEGTQEPKGLTDYIHVHVSCMCITKRFIMQIFGSHINYRPPDILHSSHCQIHSHSLHLHMYMYIQLSIFSCFHIFMFKMLLVP